MLEKVTLNWDAKLSYFSLVILWGEENTNLNKIRDLGAQRFTYFSLDIYWRRVTFCMYNISLPLARRTHCQKRLVLLYYEERAIFHKCDPRCMHLVFILLYAKATNKKTALDSRWKRKNKEEKEKRERSNWKKS